MTAQNQELDNLTDYPPAIFLMGPTASGKSSVALEIARHLPVEIISVDSAQVYQRMNIGTAKPSAETLAAVPHHLIDLIEPHAHYSAAQFRHDALAAMHMITGRGNIPLLVGGTMLYFRALLEGLAELPAADGNVRMAINSMAAVSSWPALHQELGRLDPVSAARIQPADSQRIQRALEVYYLTGKPMSQILQSPAYCYLPYQVTRIALLPSDRAALHQRIAQRFEAMLELGLVDEVRAIRNEYDLSANTPAMRCVGYRQVSMYLNEEISLTEMCEMGVAATRQLAKRQLTWLRPMQGLEKFDCLAENLSQQVLQYLRSTGLGAAAGS